MKKLLFLISLFIFLIGSITAFADEISVKVNEKQVVFPDVKPCIIENYKYVPVRFLAEAMGCSVSWENNTAILKLDGQEMKCKVGEDTAIVKENGKYKTMKIVLKQGRVLVPVDFIVQTLKHETKVEY